MQPLSGFENLHPQKRNAGRQNSENTYCYYRRRTNLISEARVEETREAVESHAVRGRGAEKTCRVYGPGRPICSFLFSVKRRDRSNDLEQVGGRGPRSSASCRSRASRTTSVSWPAEGEPTALDTLRPFGFNPLCGVAL